MDFRGELYKYDKCLIATGAQPIIPPEIEGLQSPHPELVSRYEYALDNVHAIRHPNLHKKICDGLKKAEKVLVMGGGPMAVEAV